MNANVNLAVIESYVGENFLTYTAFCRKCGISLTTFNKIRNGGKIRLTALIKIARTINVDLSKLIV